MQKSSFLKSKKLWKRFLVIGLAIPSIVISIALSVLYSKQDEIVQGLIKTINEDFRGRIELKDSHISPFANFPFVSIDLEEVIIYETKEKDAAKLAHISELFLGFHLWSIIGGNLNINEITLRNGEIELVQHTDGRFNIEIALSSEKEIENPSDEFHIDLSEIKLENIDIHKLNEENNILIDAMIFEADAQFSQKPSHTYVFFDSDFELNIIENGDTSFIKHKHFNVHTKLDYLTKEDRLVLQPTTIHLDHSEFNMEGSIDFLNDMYLDLVFSGNKKNFNLFIDMAPEELIPTLESFENRGKIFFEASVVGKSIHGKSPAINAKFGCENGFFRNPNKDKEVSDLNFLGSFTNGNQRNPSTMKFTIQDFKAQPEAGVFSANIDVTNFNDPEIEFELNSSFELDFLKEFFNLNDISEMSGTVDLKMKFHDIINLDAPEHAIQKLNEAYYASLNIKDLKFKYDKRDVPVNDLDLFAEMNGHKAIIDYCNLKLGNTDLAINGEISDLPAILHHTDLKVDTRLNINSKLIDLYELTGADTNAVDEQIRNLRLSLDFKSSAKAITESPNLPVGEFFIEDLYADLAHYPHSLHDFHADIIVDNENLKIIDFKGMIDKTDFLFSGNLKHYDLWLDSIQNGDTEVDFDFVSNHLRLEDLLSYKGENYIPEEYRHEELKDFKFHGNAKLHFKKEFHSVDLQLDHFKAKMKIHPLKFQNFNGRVHYEEDHLVVEDFSGKIGHSDFKTTLHYYLGEDISIKKRDNHFSIASHYLDVDEIVNYNATPTEKPEDHDSIFNIYTLPFTNMTYHVDIDKLNYHHYTLNSIHARVRTTPKHYIYLDTVSLLAAGGKISTKGYFNGSNPNLIYFSPDMQIDKIDLDQLFLKFDNFGQDHLVSENLHGEFTGHITGKIHMHTDLTPIIDDSEINVGAHIENGALENFTMLESFSDYFKDKNLKKVLFDTLENHFAMKNGELNIPEMTINTTLGFIKISGKQDADYNYEYYMSIPWKLVNQTVASKLFGKKKTEVDPNQVDEIQYGDKKTKYVNLLVKGDANDYTVKLKKKRKGS